MSILDEQIVGQLSIDGEPRQLAGTFEEVGRHIMDILLQENVIRGRYAIELLFPKEFARLNDEDIVALKNQYDQQIPGRIFLAIELGLATFKQLGIKQTLNKQR